jgi:hypothetical protein
VDRPTPDDPVHLNFVEHSGFIPAAQPAYSPPVNSLPQLGRTVQLQESRLYSQRLRLCARPSESRNGRLRSYWLRRAATLDNDDRPGVADCYRSPTATETRERNDFVSRHVMRPYLNSAPFGPRLRYAGAVDGAGKGNRCHNYKNSLVDPKAAATAAEFGKLPNLLSR